MSVDDEYDHDDVEIADDRRSRQSDAKLAKGELAQQKRAERNQSLTAQKAEDRFNAIKHLVIALGEYVVLRLQDHSPLSSGHCVLQPVEHVAALSEARASRRARSSSSGRPRSRHSTRAPGAWLSSACRCAAATQLTGVSALTRSHASVTLDTRLRTYTRIVHCH
jgi:hypothetical protein